MKTQNSRNGTALSAALLFLSSMALQADIVTVNSSPFSLGYGFISPGVWSTNETSGANTPTTQGDFQFLPTVSSPLLTGNGPTFPSRVLSNGNSSSYSTYVDDAPAGLFTASVTANWNGTLPTNFIPGTATLQLTLTGIKIWASGLNDPGFFRFDETTVGHTSSSPSMTPGGAAGTGSPSPANFTNAAVWVQMAWDPADYSVSGVTQTRTFSATVGDDLTNPASYIYTALDGYEVLGNVTLTYEIVPEPSALLLLSLSGGILMLRRRLR